jgi:hypothetical protein
MAVVDAAEVDVPADGDLSDPVFLVSMYAPTSLNIMVTCSASVSTAVLLDPAQTYTLQLSWFPVSVGSTAAVLAPAPPQVTLSAANVQVPISASAVVAITGGDTYTFRAQLASTTADAATEVAVLGSLNLLAVRAL